MSDEHAGRSDLGTAPAELPPGVDAPSPPAERDRIAAVDHPPADVVRDIRQLADRVGGFARLRELVAELERTTR